MIQHDPDSCDEELGDLCSMSALPGGPHVLGDFEAGFEEGFEEREEEGGSGEGEGGEGDGDEEGREERVERWEERVRVGACGRAGQHLKLHHSSVHVRMGVRVDSSEEDTLEKAETEVIVRCCLGGQRGPRRLLWSCSWRTE